MDNKKFKEPDAATVKRMTPQSITALLDTLKDQRAEKVKYIDEEIAYYEDLLKKKTPSA